MARIEKQKLNSKVKRAVGKGKRRSALSESKQHAETKMTNRFVLRFGALVPRIDTQLKEQGIVHMTGDYIGQFQMDADSIVRLAVRGLLTEDEALRSRSRLMKTVTTYLEMNGG